MKKLSLVLSTLLLSVTLVGCANGSWTKRDTGTVAGGVVGAAAGNVLTGGSTLGTAVGAVGGAVAGNQLAK